MAVALNPKALTAAFQQAGYDDVKFGDVVKAWRDDGRAWEVVIDRSGRVKATVTYPAAPAEEKSVQVSGREALVLIETTATITVNVMLDDDAQLQEVLRAVEEAVSGPPPAVGDQPAQDGSQMPAASAPEGCSDDEPQAAADC